MGKGWKKLLGMSMLLTSSLLLAQEASLYTSEQLACVKPLRAYRPQKDVASRLVAPPYNCLTVAQARELAQSNPYSFLHVSRPEVGCDIFTQPYDKQSAHQGKGHLQAFIDKGLLIQDSRPSFYVYQQSFGGSTYWCMIGHVAIHHYSDGLIRPHEAIYPKKKQALIDFTRIENAHVDPVLLMHKPSFELDVFIAQVKKRVPDQCFFSENGTTHTVWRIDDLQEVMFIEKKFQRLGPFYIADGHHRCAAALHLKKNDDKKNGSGRYDYMLAALIPEDHIAILPYHRLVRDLNGQRVVSFLKSLKASFIVEKVGNISDFKLGKKHTYGMYLDGVWYSLRIKNKIVRHYKKNSLSLLDMNLLNRYLFKPLLDIGSLAISDRLECVGGHIGLNELAELCDKRRWRLAFALPPVTTKQLTRVVDAGMLMLPKTTWFEPKLWQGLFTSTLE